LPDGHRLGREDSQLLIIKNNPALSGIGFFAAVFDAKRPAVFRI
jgi:hypothetical protein